jgi:hypothetical protein
VSEHNTQGITIKVVRTPSGDGAVPTAVYRAWIAAGDTKAGTWTPTLSPSKWKGGCQDGTYYIAVDTDLVIRWDTDFKSETFTCAG